MRGKRAILWAVTFGLAVSIAGAADLGRPLTAEEDARARLLMREIACLVCEGQSIAESDAPVAAAMRARLEDAVREGLSDADVRARIAADYGDAALLRPGLGGGGALLWAAPVLVLALAGGLAVLILGPRARARSADPDPGVRAEPDEDPA